MSPQRCTRDEVHVQRLFHARVCACVCVCACVIELVHVLVHACVIELVHVLVTVSSMRMRALSLHGYVCVYVCLYVLTGACLWLCD